MTHDFERTHLWKSSLAKRAAADEHEIARDRLRGAYLKFRDRVSHLVSTIKSELPGLTVHDITHLDALWRVASEIAGPTYELTPAEAFVLGGAILLHDSAHAIAAFPGGKAEIKQTQHWRDLIAQRYNRQEPAVGSDDERAALFQVLRHLHATQAAKLPFVKWTVPGDDTPNFLIEDAELRNYYGELIGRIAESHHWPAHRIATELSHQNHTPPSYLPTEWTVDAMKIALLLRTADAAHIDNARAPWFLFALQKPEGLSAQHWHFQSKLGQAKCNAHGELQISSASSFGADEREAWWLAYDTVQMVDRELRDAHGLMRDHGRVVFRAISVLGSGSSESFARYVKPRGWEPIDVAPKIGNVGNIIDMLGGEKLYGQKPEFALRELLQNSIDAIHAKRALGGLSANSGEIVVLLNELKDDHYQLIVSDDGVGMSRYVLTNVLLDFGNSLWKSDDTRDQWPGLSSSAFKPIGKFGIGFYSVFMLGPKVSVTSQRWSQSAAIKDATCYVLDFHEGLKSRPSLREAVRTTNSSGTEVAVSIATQTLITLLTKPGQRDQKVPAPSTTKVEPQLPSISWMIEALGEWIEFLIPMADVKISVGTGDVRQAVLDPDDWLSISDEKLLKRIWCEKLASYAMPTQLIRLANGEVAGRVGLGSSYGGGLLHTYGGIVCDHTDVLFGVIRSGNAQNAARTSSATDYPISTWKEWAERLCSESREQLMKNQMLLLNYLLPDEDFPVFTLDGEDFSAVEVAQQAGSATRVLIHAGYFEYHDNDDVTPKKFEREFWPSDDVICYPKSCPPSPNAWRGLPLAQIDYADRLRAAFKAQWPLLKELQQMQAVGEVDGTTIERYVLVFER